MITTSRLIDKIGGNVYTIPKRSFVKSKKTIIDSALNAAANHILSNQAPNGGFPFSFAEKSSLGAWATSQAICAVLSLDNELFPRIEKSLRWLEERHIDFSWSSMEGGAALLDSGAWAVLAFEMASGIESKYSDVVEKALSKIVGSANKDGGWGSWKGDTSRAIVTSVILSLLERSKHLSMRDEFKSSLNEGIGFLLGSQNADGGWGFRRNQNSSLVSTAYALIALSGTKADKDSISNGLEWLESEKRKYYDSRNSFFKQESIWRPDSIQRWSYFTLPIMAYAFIANGKTYEVFKDIKNLLSMQQPDGSWVDPSEPYLAFHTYSTVFFLSNIKKMIDQDKFEGYCEALNAIQKEEFESLILASKSKLKRLILEEAFKISQDEFMLSSGKRSKYLYDLKKILLEPTGISIIGKILWELTKSENIDAIGGPETGAIPIATAVATESYSSGKPLKAFFVRKKPKEHGTRHWIEGNLNHGDNVIVVEDVVTTGGSLLKAIEKIKEYNCNIFKVICIVDREEGAAEKFRDMGIKFESLFKHSDFKVVL